MDGSMGLRERKKQRTRETISEVAIALFLEHGFDQVSVADVAAAAEVSKPTLFRYFPTKEDLVVQRFADHQDEAAEVVRNRPAGVGPLDALHRHFVEGLEAGDPVTGLSDHEAVLSFHRLLYSTPGLVARSAQYLARAEEELARALAETLGEESREVTPRLLAGQLVATQRILAMTNWQRIVDGRSAQDVRPEALADADHAFSLLSRGLTTLGATPETAHAAPTDRGDAPTTG
ncbi:TetR/AcrR family transcriptional regulator [Streptomyces sp. NPDC060184]|uniref:TetR/AcrR family transcriptional regulator n=1 Tax=Streptomyces sp. NPDC060184 TaxID=3347064 RepID=UPI003649F409